VTQTLIGDATSGTLMLVRSLSRTLHGDSSLGVFNIVDTLVVMAAVLVIAAAALMRRAVRIQTAGTPQLQDGA